jgi:GntR family transcriptional repressor for pyruvate dehydrogenase complex
MRHVKSPEVSPIEPQFRPDAVTLPIVRKPDRGPLTVFVAEQLKDMILAGEVVVGDRLPTEADLSEHFGVSRVTIREAIQTLRALGLVEAMRGRGTFVRQPDADARLRDLAYFAFDSAGPIDDVFEVRELLERQAALGAAQAPVSERARLMDVVRAMRAVIDSEDLDVEALEELDMAFHLLIAELGGNLVLEQLMRRLMQILAVVRARSLSSPNQPQRSWVQHRQIADAIIAGDVDLAINRVAEHINSVKAAVLEVSSLTRSEDAGPGPPHTPGPAPRRPAG